MLWRRDLKVERLNDEGAQYQIVVTCKCGHFKKILPGELAGHAGWDAKIDVVASRLRCSHCGGRDVGWHVTELPRRTRG
jgi:hypothetical protein